VAKPEWGIKRICPNCGTRYYDMRKDPPVCPSCATTFDPEALLRSRRARPVVVDEPKRAPAASEEELEDVEVEEIGDEEVEGIETEADDLDTEGLEEDAEVVEEDEEDVLIEDTSELGDEDDVGEVVDLEEGDEER